MQWVKQHTDTHSTTRPGTGEYTQSRRLELDQYLSSTYEIRQTSRSTCWDDRSTLREIQPYYTAKYILRSHLGVFASSVHNLRLSTYTQIRHEHSRGGSTSRDGTSRPIHKTAQPYHIAKSIPRSHLDFDLARPKHTLHTNRPGRSTTRTTHTGLRTGQHSGFDLCRTHTTLGSAQAHVGHT